MLLFAHEHNNIIILLKTSIWEGTEYLLDRLPVAGGWGLTRRMMLEDENL